MITMIVRISKNYFDSKFILGESLLTIATADTDDSSTAMLTIECTPVQCIQGILLTNNAVQYTRIENNINVYLLIGITTLAMLVTITSIGILLFIACWSSKRNKSSKY